MRILDANNAPFTDPRFSFALDSATSTYKLTMNQLSSLAQIGELSLQIEEKSYLNAADTVLTPLTLKFPDPCASLQLTAPDLSSNPFFWQSTDKNGKIEPTDTEAAFVDLRWSSFVTSQNVPICSPVTL